MSIRPQFFGSQEGGSQKLRTAFDVAAHIQQHLPNVHSGTLRFWGVWFGKPHDNYHTIVKAEAENDCLIVRFNEEETLRVWHPQALQVDSQKFVIGLASRVLWQWSCSGRPHTPGNLMGHDYVRRGTEIDFSSTFRGGNDARPDFNEPAVQIN